MEKKILTSQQLKIWDWLQKAKTNLRKMGRGDQEVQISIAALLMDCSLDDALKVLDLMFPKTNS